MNNSMQIDAIFTYNLIQVDVRRYFMQIDASFTRPLNTRAHANVMRKFMPIHGNIYSPTVRTNTGQREQHFSTYSRSIHLRPEDIASKSGQSFIAYSQNNH